MQVRDLDVKDITEAVRSSASRPTTTCRATCTTRSSRPGGRRVAGRARGARRSSWRTPTSPRRDRVPICQDTGFAVIFAEVGQDVHLAGGDFEAAIHEGVRQGYGDGYLRKSVAEEPGHARRNTKDNTPAIIHTSSCPATRSTSTMMAKGGGAENMSSLNMLKPAQGWAGMVRPSWTPSAAPAPTRARR